MRNLQRLALGTLLAVSATAALSQVLIKQAYPSPNYWTNDPFTPGFSLLEQGGGLTYQVNWPQYPAFRGNPSRGVVGTIRIPVLLVDWSDFNPLTDDVAPEVAGIQTCPEYTPKSPSDISAMLNSDVGAKGYFREISGGKLNITFDVLPWIQSANSAYLKPRSAYLTYDAQGQFLGADNIGMSRDALRAAIAEKNLNLLNYDADQNRVLDGLMVMYEGCSGTLGGSRMLSFNGVSKPEDATNYQHNAKELVPASDPNKAKFDTQNILYNRFILNATSGAFYTAASQVHELGHLLLGYDDNYFFNPPFGTPYAGNDHWLLSATHGAPVPYHASALEKWLFGGWFSPTYAQARSMTYAIFDHQLSGAQLTAGYKQPTSLGMLRIPVNGDPDHFLTVEFRHMAPPDQGGSAFNLQAPGGQQIITGVQVFEVDRRKSYFTYEQIRRVLPTRLQVNYMAPWDQAWRPGDSYVFRDGAFGVQIEYYGENLNANPRASTASVVVRHLNAPTLNAPVKVSATVGLPMSFSASATDPDLGDTQSWAMPYAPPGASFNANTRTVTWTPTKAQTAVVTLRVTDSKGLYDERSVVITAK